MAEEFDPAWEYATRDADLWGDDDGTPDRPSGDQVYDALRCGAIAVRDPGQKKKTGECAVCGGPIRERPTRAGTQKYCSRACYRAAGVYNPKPRTQHPCAVCHKPFTRRRASQANCSPQCGAVARRGPRGAPNRDR